MKPQYETLIVEVDYSEYFSDEKSHWYPALGWNTRDEAEAAWPNMKFRLIDPPLPTTQEIIDTMCEAGFRGGN